MCLNCLSVSLKMLTGDGVRLAGAADGAEQSEFSSKVPPKYLLIWMETRRVFARELLENGQIKKKF